MAAKSTQSGSRQAGALRRVVKRANGKEYPSWQWRTHRRGDLGWEKVDLELGADLTGLRTRVYVALGELKAPLLVERWARWHFRGWEALPAYTGIKGKQRAAWWCELPRAKDQAVKLRFRSLAKGTDFRRGRTSIAKAEEVATGIWNDLIRDPVVELARLLWLEREGQKRIDAINGEQLPKLRKLRRQGELNKRDFEADERDLYRVLETWEEMVGTVRGRWDDQLAAIEKAMPRGRKEEVRTRVVALAERLSGDVKQLREWESSHWDGTTLCWAV